MKGTGLSCPFEIQFPLWFRKRKSSFRSFNKSFIDQVCSVKMTGYWTRSFLCFHELKFCCLVFFLLFRFCFVSVFEAVLSIHYFHIDHNACCLPSKFCMTIVSKFSWVLQSPLGKSKTTVMQNFFFWGGDKQCVLWPRRKW